MISIEGVCPHLTCLKCKKFSEFVPLSLSQVISMLVHCMCEIIASTAHLLQSTTSSPGASRGFGRALAVELGKVVGAGSTLLLLARSKEELEVVS